MAAHKFDKNRITVQFLDSMKEVTGLNHLISLPLFNNSYALFYNKDLFNRFGVKYPTDQMTWQDVHALSNRLTRQEGGVQYWGLWADGSYRGAYQLELPFLDVVTNKPVFQSDGWKELFQLWSGMWNYPGVGAPPSSYNFIEGFLKGEVAMMPGFSNQIFDVANRNAFDWDVVTYPTNPKAPGVGQRAAPVIMSITEQSKHKDAAMQVLSVLLSDEVQTDISKTAKVSVLKEASVQQQFAKDTPVLASKNMVAFTKLKYAKAKSFGIVPTGTAAGIPIAAFNDVVFKGKDINTALREADEKMAQAIKEELSK